MIIIAGYTAIADAGNSFIKLLQENMTPDPILKPEMLALCAPSEKGDFRLTLHLYLIKENGEWRNPEVPRLSLSLYYLLTAHSTAELKSRAFDENCILGKAMQVIYANSVLKGSYLQGALAEKNEELRIILNYLSPEELSKIWIFPNTPYKTSLSYMVGPIFIDSTGFTDIKRVMK